jgi:hypothetical protein
MNKSEQNKEIKESTFLTMLLLLVTFISWVVMVSSLWTNLTILTSARWYSDLTEMGYHGYLEPVVVLISLFLWLPANLFLALVCYLRLPFRIKLKIVRK